MSWVIFNIVEGVKNYSRQQELKLAEALAINDVTTVKQLLDRGVDPNAKVVGKTGEPLIFLVFEKKHFTLPQGSIGDRHRAIYCLTAKERCLRLLLKYGVDPNVRDSLGRTVLDIAIIWCMPDVVKWLLMNGADPNLRDNKQLTPLMKTAILGIRDARSMQDKLQIVMHLIDSGVEIDARSLDGKTALMYATGNTRLEIVELLVSSGASLSICDRQGNRACDIIGQSVSDRQRLYLQRILTQPQLNVVKHKYREFVPEGDLLLNEVITNKLYLN